jgi:23S rRNA (pseudouridine1915-N3)-methyltransferase
MKIVVVAVGRMRDKNLSAACDEYVARARHHLPIEIVEVADDATLQRRIPASADIIALEPGGDSWDTARLTKHIDECMIRGPKTLAFLIGGSDGLSKAAVARANRRLSLSAMTLPHRLARVVLCEQIYRALSIIKGEPYSR